MTTKQEKMSHFVFKNIAYDLETFKERKSKRVQEEIDFLKQNSKSSGTKVKVVVNGVQYESMNAAARAFRITSPAVKYRCDSTQEHFKNWNFHGSETSTR